MCSQAVLLSIRIVRKMRRLKCKWPRVIGVSFWPRGSTGRRIRANHAAVKNVKLLLTSDTRILRSGDTFQPGWSKTWGTFQDQELHIIAHWRGCVSGAVPAWRKKRFTWRGRFWELVNNRWFTLSSFSWSLPSLVVDKLTSYSVF